MGIDTDTTFRFAGAMGYLLLGLMLVLALATGLHGWWVGRR